MGKRRESAPSRYRVRIAVAAGFGVGAGLLHAWLARHTSVQGDFAPAWLGARILVGGSDPYLRIGPNAATIALGVRTRWPLVYPPSALVWALPFAALPLAIGQACFAGVGAALLAFALSAPRDGHEERPRWGRLWAFIGCAVLSAIQFAQWEPLLTGAWALAPLAILYSAKPTVGFALLLARQPDARRVWWAGVGLLASIVAVAPIAPQIVVEWWRNTHSLTHLRVPLAAWQGGGPLLLIALLRWRRPEARLLLALACVPGTTLPYATVPLCLVAGGTIESLLLVLGSWAVISLAPPPIPAPASVAAPSDSFDAWAASVAPLLVAFMYLPCLVMVLRRPNEGSMPAWVESLAEAGRGRLSRRDQRRRAPDETGTPAVADE